MINENNFHYIHRIAKRTKPFLKKKNRFTEIMERDFSYDLTINNIISKKIAERKPLMIARFGSTESRAIVNFLTYHKNYTELKAIYKYLIGEIGVYWKKSPKYLDYLMKLSGFFPQKESLLQDFVDLMLEDSKQLDILGIWNELEEYIPTIPQNTVLCKIRDLEPWFYENPWSESLEGKKVLIVHPFEQTIINQYNFHRKEIYKNEKILPQFELKTIKAVQTIADEKSEFGNWFEALDSMKEKIDHTDFDIAIIGCGAYGFPLAAHIKRIGKQAIHMGGVTQLLFGIKGKRWEDWEHYTQLRKEHWVYANEKPKGFNKVEDGCYW